VIALAARNASEWTGPSGNVTYLFDRPPSLLVDAGIGDPAHVEEIAATLHGQPLHLVVATHSHSDHIAGIPALRARWPDLSVRGGPGAALEEGEVLNSGGARLIAIHTPGHAPDHFCLLDESRRDVYCGDLVRLGGTVVIPASRGGSLRQYLDSLRRIRALHPERLLPGHGPIIDNPMAVIDEYLAHRAMRERQVLDALAAGCDSAEVIAARIYPGLSATLHAAACETVEAHLVKLREEGRA
jgi:glyoxylase-like metal-dependent hydrolase (beta-lactamase superfamily II)